MKIMVLSFSIFYLAIFEKGTLQRIVGNGTLQRIVDSGTVERIADS